MSIDRPFKAVIDILFYFVISSFSFLTPVEHLQANPYTVHLTENHLTLFTSSLLDQ